MQSKTLHFPLKNYITTKVMLMGIIGVMINILNTCTQLFLIIHIVIWQDKVSQLHVILVSKNESGFSLNISQYHCASFFSNKLFCIFITSIALLVIFVQTGPMKTLLKCLIVHFYVKVDFRNNQNWKLSVSNVFH